MEETSAQNTPKRGLSLSPSQPLTEAQADLDEKVSSNHVILSQRNSAHQVELQGERGVHAYSKHNESVEKVQKMIEECASPTLRSNKMKHTDREIKFVCKSEVDDSDLSIVATGVKLIKGNRVTD